MAEENLEKVMTTVGGILFTKEEKDLLKLAQQMKDANMDVEEKLNFASSEAGVSPKRAKDIMWSIVGKIGKEVESNLVHS